MGEAGGSSFEELIRKVMLSPSFGKVNCLIGETAFLPSIPYAFCEKFWFWDRTIFVNFLPELL